MRAPIPFVGQVDSDELNEWISLLSEALPDHTILPFDEVNYEQYDQVELAITANPKPEDLDLFPNLKWIHSVWAGVERMVHDLKDRDFDIVRLVDPELSRTMAEAVLAWSMYLHRDMPGYAKLQQEKNWKALPYTRAADRHIGILGLGALGNEAAKLLNVAGFKVSGWSRSLKEIEGVDCYSGKDGLQSLLSASDILVILLPLTDETRGMLNANTLKMLPKGAGLINFARGAIIDRDALEEHLASDQISHAVLDVFETEPLASDDSLWTNEKVTVLPHISAPTDTKTASRIVADNIDRYFKSGEMPPTVNRSKGY